MRRKYFESQLPAAPCTPEMRDAVDKMAGERHVPAAQIVREAVALFLQTGIRNPDIGESNKSAKAYGKRRKQ